MNTEYYTLYVHSDTKYRHWLKNTAVFFKPRRFRTCSFNLMDVVIQDKDSQSTGSFIKNCLKSWIRLVSEKEWTLIAGVTSAPLFPAVPIQHTSAPSAAQFSPCLNNKRLTKNKRQEEITFILLSAARTGESGLRRYGYYSHGYMKTYVHSFSDSIIALFKGFTAAGCPAFSYHVMLETISFRKVDKLNRNNGQL